MALTKHKLGELVELVDETNSEGKYGPKDVRGMTITKEIIPTKADVSNADLTKFIVVHPGEFVFNPRTHGKKIGFGYNNTTSNFIISWNNIAFKVKDEAADVVIPTYLFLHFNRDEWDREACYRSWGTSTEVFSWEALCDMQVTLPAIDVQQKFVAVYQALQNNLAVYQSKVDDLRLVCDGYIDQLKKTAPIKKLQDYIEDYDERNTMQSLSVDSVKGISTDKKFIDTKANMLGVSLDSYKVVEPNTFAYVPDTSRRGEKMAIAFNSEGTPLLISSIYTTFKSKDENRLLPEYLFMFLNRPEFDRYARFHSWGSAREVFSLDDMNEVEIPIPDIKVQQEIVNIHRCYLERQRIAVKLREEIARLCPILIKGSLQSDN